VLMFVQHVHVSAAELHDWLCTDDEYSRLLIPANESSAADIVRVTLTLLLLAFTGISSAGK